MDYITLTELKAHIVVEDNDDDYLLELYRDSAIDVIQRNYDVNFNDEYVANENVLPPSLKQATLLLANDFYLNRGNVSNSSIAPKLVPTMGKVLESWIKYNI